jgi:hypothetical protein
MIDEIGPALTRDEWSNRAVVRNEGIVKWPIRVEAGELRITPAADGEEFYAGSSKTLVTLVALANAALPRYDPRKITHEKIAALWFAANECRANAMLGEEGSEARRELAERALILSQFADALDSYLPPER